MPALYVTLIWAWYRIQWLNVLTIPNVSIRTVGCTARNWSSQVQKTRSNPTHTHTLQSWRAKNSHYYCESVLPVKRLPTLPETQILTLGLIQKHCVATYEYRRGQDMWGIFYDRNHLRVIVCVQELEDVKHTGHEAKCCSPLPSRLLALLRSIYSVVIKKARKPLMRRLWKFVLFECILRSAFPLGSMLHCFKPAPSNSVKSPIIRLKKCASFRAEEFH